MTTFPQLLIAISAVGALVVSIYNATQISIIHVSINSRMTELIELTQKASRAEGIKQGQEEFRKPVKQ